MSEKNQEPVELIVDAAEDDGSTESTSACAKTSTHHSFNAHMVTGITGRDANAVLVAPQIDNILEEDEEEEEVEQDKQNVEIVVPQEQQEQEPSVEAAAPPSTNQPAQHTPIKFILEPVVLNLPTENTAVAGASSSTTTTKKEVEKSTVEPNLNDVVVEFKVEEGYATRQMDENFRQTIAAIKEELTKKLETKKERFDPDGDGYDDTDSEVYDDNSLLDDPIGSTNNIDTGHHGRIEDPVTDYDPEDGTTDTESHQVRHFTHYVNLRNNRNLLYQHIMSLMTARQPSKQDRINGWLVILGCFINQFIIDGMCYNYGVLFSRVKKEFEIESSLIAVMPGAFLIGFFVLVAPLSVFLTKEFGQRRVAVAGTFIATISLLISALWSNIIIFILFYGVFTGIGIGLVYVPSLITTSKWFLKKRLFANSLNILGACLGAAIYPLLSEFILQKYDLFDSLLILAGVQLNCLVGSLLLKPHHKHNHNHHYNHNNLHLTSPGQSSNRKVIINHNADNRARGPLNARMATRPISNRRPRDMETESNVSVSVASQQNYTLKQYWRKFVQTRQQNSSRKNLFHLIAEEKRKTRTMSKQSLEDGFYITTSNNLLAPNDESHVVVTRRDLADNSAAGAAATGGLAVVDTPYSNMAASSRSRFFTRIANSLRSLTFHHHHHASQHSTSLANQPLSTTTATGSPSISRNVAIHEVNETPSTSTKPQSNVIPLMSVFEGPLPNPATTATTSSDAANQEDASSLNQMQDNDNSSEELDTDTDAETMMIPSCNENNTDGMCDDDDEDDCEYEARKRYYSQNAAKINARYMNYRKSLTNSVRGSLMEFSVPEENNSNENTRAEPGSNVVPIRPVHSNQRLKKYMQQQRVSNSGRRAAFNPPANSTASNPNDVRIRPGVRFNGNYRQMHTMYHNTNSHIDGAGYAMPSLFHIRRFMSTIDAASFVNAPLNLESIEFNLRNSLIKRCSDKYRKSHHHRHHYHHHNKQTANNHSDSANVKCGNLFLDYIVYLTSYRLFLNKMLLLLNFSFFLNMCGLSVVIIYIQTLYIHKAALFKPTTSMSHQSATTNTKQSNPTSDSLNATYILCLAGLMGGLGRLIATLAYKVNESNAKSRIFAYIMALVLAGASILLSTILCDTVFSFAMFGITFGLLFGFSLNLRTLFVYDIVGLEWSDDSLFSMMTVSQSLGASIGLPLASLLLDTYKEPDYVFYLAGACFLISGLVLMPGRKLKKYLPNSLKPLNRYYLQKGPTCSA